MNATGAELRDAGIEQATDNAEAAAPGWADQALDYVKWFAKQGVRFKAEHVRDYATRQGLPNPPHARAWGGVIRRAATMGMIKRVGFASCANPSAHCAPVGVWVGVSQ